MNEVKVLLFNIQEDVDHDDVCKVLIEFDLNDLLIEMLQTDNFGISQINLKKRGKNVTAQEGLKEI
jgi:hypothetical protein